MVSSDRPFPRFQLPRICIMEFVPNSDCTQAATETVARRSRGKLVALLAARSGDLESAEDALSEAFAAALATWPRDGCPANPEAWLLTVARRKLIDRHRGQREDAATDELEQLAATLDRALDEDLPDRRWACCLPAPIRPSTRPCARH